MTRAVIVPTSPLDLSAIDRADLAPSTKAQYRKEIAKMAAAGVNPTDHAQLQEYAASLKQSSRQFLKSALRLMTQDLEQTIKANARPETIAETQAALYRLDAMQNAVHVDVPKGQKAHTWLSASQVVQLTSQCPDTLEGKRDWIVLGLLLGAGLRREELAGLRFDAIKTLPMKDGGSRTVIEVTGKGSNGEWVQASFGSRDNLFSSARLDIAGKNAVLDQFEQTIARELAELELQQKQQLLGNIAGLAVELIKSVEINSRAPVNPQQNRALITRSFNLLSRVLDDARLGLEVKQMLVGYLQGSDSFLALLEGAQKKEIAARHERYNPKTPFNYEEWDRIGKSVIKVEDIEGEGEGFLYGFVEWLKTSGLGNASWGDGNKLQVISGDGVWGSTKLRVTVSKNDPINAWKRDMTVEINVSEFRNDMFRGLGQRDVDITGYNGHSGFGRATLKSFDGMPEQQGDKLFYRFVCAGMDVENGIALRAPQAFANSYTTQDSGYFRTREDTQHGKYAYEAEGWLGIRALIRGVLGKKTHEQIQADMKSHANWWGHTEGNTNNFVGPGDKRRGGSGDWDNDGIPNMFDVMPTVNTFDVGGDVAREFALKVPNVPIDQIKGDRAFAAIGFTNTATNYTSLLSRYNENRKLVAHPGGVWFEDKSSPPKYVKFSPGSDGQTYVEMNSALANMTIETLRAVMFYETSQYLLAKNNSPSARTQAERVAASLLFAASALEYDMSWRDDAVFAGLSKMYGIPSSVGYGTFKGVMYGLAERHNYGGDANALRTVLQPHQTELSAAGVGQPSIAVT